MPNPYLFPICRTRTKNSNYHTHMYYISINRNLYINISKKKMKYAFVGTTPTTLLKPAPVHIDLSYPRCFGMVTTLLRQPATFYFLRPYFAYIAESLDYTFCRMSYPCLRSFKTQKTR